MKRQTKHQTIPKFATEDEERKFWAMHDSMRYFGSMRVVKEPLQDARPSKKAISIRVDEPALDQLKRMAGKKGLGYQTLMRMWVLERLEQEMAKRG
jgi:predicted DNA binding CopG/RHH family protein